MPGLRSIDVVLRPEPEGGFTVRVPALPEIVSWGETEQEALSNAEEAISLVVEDRTARGEPVPSPDAVRMQSVQVNVPA